MFHVGDVVAYVARPVDQPGGHLFWDLARRATSPVDGIADLSISHDTVGRVVQQYPNGAIVQWPHGSAPTCVAESYLRLVSKYVDLTDPDAVQRWLAS